MFRSKAVLAGFAALAVLAWLGAFALPARAQQAPVFKPEQKAAIEQILKDYIMAHPEIVQDALLEMDKRQKDLRVSY